MIGDKLARRFSSRMREVAADYKKTTAAGADAAANASLLAVATTLEIIAAIVDEVFELHE